MVIIKGAIFGYSNIKPWWSLVNFVQNYIEAEGKHVFEQLVTSWRNKRKINNNSMLSN